MMKSTIQLFKTNQCAVLATCALVAILPTFSFSQAPGADAAGAEPTDHRPEKFSPGRYRTTFSSSAFEREILPPAKVDNTPPPTPFDLKVVGVSGNEGRYRVTLVDKKGKYVVVTDEPNTEGFRYSAIEPAANIAEFRVEVSKDGQTEWAEFDDKRYTIVSKAVASAKKPTLRGGRPNVVPSSRKAPPSRAPIPQSKSAKEASKKAGQAAIKTLNAANAAAVNKATSATDKSKSKVSGRRVVLPPKSRSK